ncbi:small hydrophilic protein [Streptomyces microflavus]|uniref:Small hydrophilic protein n=1 Tax=Streptomyces microflavus TaxID=1919 RepID=A0A7H8MU61_STRMI|nr:small hydrophilic protein [Streptomyces microflavus]QKW45617.1 small hydrophilic protein [Streptomyces microflavus]
MAFSPRLAALAAVVAVPLGIAATSYAMTDTPEAPKVPPAVQLDERPDGAPTPGPSASPSAPASPSSPSSPSSTGGDVVPGPSAADGDDDDDDDLGDDG